MSEQTYKCEFCGQPGFTRRGLRVHWCKKNPLESFLPSKCITKEQWLKMLEAQKPPLACSVTAASLQKEML